jgi:HD-like signal output (HDOD) protein
MDRERRNDRGHEMPPPETDVAGSLGRHGEVLKTKLLELFRSPDFRPPLLPVVALELLQLVRRPNVRSADIVKLLGHDPLLAGQMLKVAQSPAYAAGDPVRSLDEAILRLGMRRTTDLCLQASLESKVFRAPGYDQVMERLRRHSVFTAELSRLVCRRTVGFDEYAFLCGLLHDVGIAACTLSLRELSRQPIAFEDAWATISAVHASCSEVLAKLWKLPHDICTVLSLHHTVSIAGRTHPLAAAIAVADCVAQELGLGFHSETHESQLLLNARAIGLDANGLAAFRSEAQVLAEKFG